jgi:hypothetical protein
MRDRGPNAVFAADAAATAPYVPHAFDPDQWRRSRPLRIILIGADFWTALLHMPIGATASNGALAKA